MSFTCAIQAQIHTKKELKPKLLNRYNEAIETYRSGNLQEAFNALAEIREKDPLFYEAWYRSASIKAEQADFQEAIDLFNQCESLEKGYKKGLYFQRANIYMEQEKYLLALADFEQYKSLGIGNERQLKLTNKLIEDCTFRKDNIGIVRSFDPIALDSVVNTLNDEYSPSLNAEENLMMFVRRQKEQEDILQAKRDKSGNWTHIESISSINTSQNEGTPSMSADGRTIVFTACNRKEGLGRCDLYISEYSNGQWSPYRNMEAPINSVHWESQPSISANGDFLFFASDRPGGFGGRDIWYSLKKEDGQWAKPINAGSSINTEYDEKTPFFHPDGQTLYFMSEGHPGFGGFDIFLSRIENDKWTTPLNLGQPINTKGDEGLLKVVFSGKEAYYATDVQSSNYDIYRFALDREIGPQPVRFVKGVVRDANTKEIISSTIDFYNLSRNKQILRRQTDEQGNFLVVLPSQQNYSLRIEKEGYLFYSKNFDLVQEGNLETQTLDIELIPLDEENVSNDIILENVFFESGSAELKGESIGELEALFELLESSDIVIQVGGHTDNVGEQKDNLLLSEQRAKAVYDYLIQKGIPAQRLSYKGYGELDPIADNASPEGRKANRRTTFRILD